MLKGMLEICSTNIDLRGRRGQSCDLGELWDHRVEETGVEGRGNRREGV